MSIIIIVLFPFPSSSSLGVSSLHLSPGDSSDEGGGGEEIP